MPECWKKSFKTGIFIPTKMRFCNECNDERMCNKCHNQVNENEELDSNLNLLKRQAPIEFGHMLPFFEE